MKHAASLATSLIALALRMRRLISVALHLVLVAMANYAAFFLRFDGDIPPTETAIFIGLLPLLLVIRALTFVPLRMFEGLWKYTSMYDLRQIVTAVATSGLLFSAVVYGVVGIAAYPRSVILIDALLLIFAMTGVRLSRRIYRDLRYPGPAKRVLIYGAGDAGEMLVREFRRHPSLPLRPVAFIDDDPEKAGARLHGIPVVGGRDSLDRALVRYRPDEIVVAIPSASGATLRSIVDGLHSASLPIRTVPRLRDILDRGVELTQLRPLSIEDLLERPPVHLDYSLLDNLVAGNTVLVTGAGGSIGGELCRQIAGLKPRRLVMLDRYENGLFAVANAVTRLVEGIDAVPVIADVTDETTVATVFRTHQPSIIFHAAAHKHVPLMESFPNEAIKNNVRGTRVVAQAAQQFFAKVFVFISTDKAANPVNVMGATKRVSEMLVRDLGRLSNVTKMIVVRFGNVLGSNGSVIPTFLEQIRTGGPVTVTHPDVRRFFMLIPEAVQLVLHSSTLPTGTYVLEMGEQVQIQSLARELIRLSGYIPDTQIRIEFTGLRPGEKLLEELVGDDEQLRPSAITKIQCVVAQNGPSDFSLGQVKMMEDSALKGDVNRAVDQLADLLPSFRKARETALPTPNW